MARVQLELTAETRREWPDEGGAPILWCVIKLGGAEVGRAVMPLTDFRAASESDELRAAAAGWLRSKLMDAELLGLVPIVVTD